MASWTLAVEGLVQLATLASFAFVGNVLRARGSHEPGAGVATRAIVAWWWGLGAYLGMLGALDLLAFVGFAPYALHLAARIVGVALLALCAWGFSTYVLYLYGGPSRALFRLTAIYGALAALAFYAETWIDHPTGVVVSAWASGLAPPADPRLLQGVYAFFAIPLVASILAYASLFVRVREPLQRYRIALVSSSLLAWVVGGFVGASSGGAAEFVAVTLLGLLAAGAVVLAYHPPRWVLARIDPESEAAIETRRRRTRLQDRLAELV
ncbi:MAG: hypothetical protein QOE90_839 [Thermoplasmata archaeon]|jgi:hypothetical protein|nr:hypothetical protein [Thermoplasmata archaeon]